MMRALAVLWVTVTLTSPAEASCGAPHWFGVFAGATLPPRGAFYVHDEALDASRDDPQLVWRGGATGTWRVTRLSRTVARVDYDARSASRAEVRPYPAARWSEPIRFDAHWRAPARTPRVVALSHAQRVWTCSSYDLLAIELDQPVAAVRVRWTFGAITRELVEVAEVGDGASFLALGKINCGSANLDPEELAIGGALELLAIRFDGSEVPVAGLPSFVSTRLVPRSSDERRPTPEPSWRGAALAALALVVSLLGAVAWRRWRTAVEPP